MTSIYEITGWADVGSFLVWTLAVCVVAKALFGSLPAAEIHYRLALRDAPKRQRIQRLHWEINHRARWDPDVARGSPHAASQPLTDEQVESRRAELQRLTRNSFTRRSLQCFLNCFACQSFWTAAAIYALTRGITEPAAWFFSAAAYSGAAVILSLPQPSMRPVGGNPSANTGGCKSCGR